MLGNARMQFGLGGIAICLISLLAFNLGAKQRPKKLLLNQVYAFRDFAWPQGYFIAPNALFSPDGRYVYLIGAGSPEIVVLDWRTNQIVRRMNYTEQFSRYPNLKEDKCYLHWFRFRFLEGTRYGMLSYCDSRFLVDSNTLEIQKAWLPDKKGFEVMHLAFSPALGYLAFYWKIRDTFGSEFVRVYDVKNWEVVAQWPARTPDVRDIAFTLDGRYLATVISPCGIELQDIESGESVSSWEGPPRYGFLPCPWKIRFIPGHEYTFITRNITLGTIGIWDARAGNLVKIIEDKGRIYEWEMSPDGRRVTGDVRKERWNSRLQQYFKIWDVDTGLVVYQSRKEKLRKTYTPEQFPRFILHFSPDSRYLLTLKYKELAIYEIIEKR